LYTARREVPDAAARFTTFDSLLEQSDVVSLHLPLTADTGGLIDRAALGRMKKGSVLINTARGGLVDQPALADALRSGHLGGAGLDVFIDEPVAGGEILLRLHNVVVTPHVAWITTGTFDRSFDLTAENCRRMAEGKALLHRVV
jgi:phosphoglycerate dehydrogenase-like enzyme